MRVILHAGIWKTGTSAIQSMLALNIDRLASFGLHYPEAAGTAHARLGHVNSGNLAVAEDEDWVDVILGHVRDTPRGHDLLLSREKMTTFFATDPDGLARLAKTVDLHVLLFVRDPWDALSAFQAQFVKRAGLTDAARDFSETRLRWQWATKAVQTLQRLGIKTRFANYSKCRDALFDQFVQMLLAERAPDFLAQAVQPGAPVNRSLTRAERALQSAFNEHFGSGAAEFVSVPLINRLPQIPVDPIPVPSDVATRIAPEIQAQTDAMNACLPQDAQVTWTPPPQSDDAGADEYTFNAAQIDLIAKTLSAQIKLGHPDVEDFRALLRITRRAVRQGGDARQDGARVLALLQRAKPDHPVVATIARELAEVTKADSASDAE